MKPTQEFSTRFEEAKKWRSLVEPYIKEVYSFCAPDRVDEFTKGGMRQVSSVDTEVYHSLGEEASDDLAGDLVTFFTPPEARWFDSLIMTEVPEEAEEQAKELVGQRESDIASLIQSSNYNDIAPQIGQEIASHGTPAMWVQKAHFQQPVYCEAVPPSELYIVPGHMGMLDRFREKTVRANTLKALFADEIAAGSVDLEGNPKIKAKINEPGSTCVVVWGFWLDWTDPGFPMWKMEITIDNHRVTPSDPVTLGPVNGSCPLLVGRFNPRSGRPWGRGPGLRALADLRVLDKIEEIYLLGLEDAIKNTIIYADDGFLDFSNGGIIPGSANPASRGFTRDQIYELNKSTDMEVAFFSKDDMERRIRSLFYQDGPRQRGDTPPTAAQWFDEARRVQQRLGKPSAPLWTEFYGPFVQRVEFLGVQMGDLDPQLLLDGRAINVQPVSPLHKAQQHDQVMIARTNMETAQVNFGPEGAMQIIDMGKTFQNILEASGDELTVIRKEDANPPQGPTNEPAPEPDQ
ncbi:MAG: portal protein [Roseovarius sp.]|nr:portal protein [Roseovarius sp.]